MTLLSAAMYCCQLRYALCSASADQSFLARQARRFVFLRVPAAASGQGGVTTRANLLCRVQAISSQ
jgi:hypothetical protein